MTLNHIKYFFSRIGILNNKSFHTFLAESTFSKIVLRYLVHLLWQKLIAHQNPFFLPFHSGAEEVTIG